MVNFVTRKSVFFEIVQLMLINWTTYQEIQSVRKCLLRLILPILFRNWMWLISKELFKLIFGNCEMGNRRGQAPEIFHKENLKVL